MSEHPMRETWPLWVLCAIVWGLVWLLQRG